MPSPLTARRSRLVPAPPGTVWNTLAALDEISRWAKNVTHSSYTTSAQGGVGAARRVQAGPLTLLETVTEWTPEKKLAYAIEGLPRVATQVTNGWELSAEGAGTRAMLTSTVVPGAGLARRVAATLLLQALGRVAAQLLDDLVTHHTRTPARSGDQ